MLMLVLFRIVLTLPVVRVGVEMHFPVVMVVDVKMNFVPDQSSQNVDSESYEHQSDHEFQDLRHPLGHHQIEDKHHRAKQEERQRMSEAPCGSLFDGVTDRIAVRRQGGYRRNVVGLDGVPHANHETEQQ
jgi:hypothetical protein